MRRTLMIIVAGIAVLYIVVYMYCSRHAQANTYLGSRNISYLSRPAVLRLLATEAKGSFQISVKNRIYTYSYKDAGVYIDVNKTFALIFAHAKRDPFYTVRSFAQSFFSQQLITPVMSFSDAFYAKFSSSQFEIAKKPNDVSVDTETKTLQFTKNKYIYRVEPEALQKQIVSSVGTHIALESTLTQIADTTEETKVLSYNQRIKLITKSPVGVVVSGDKTAAFSFSAPELLSLLSISYDQTADNLAISIDTMTLSDIVHRKEVDFDRGDDYTFDTNTLQVQLVHMAAARFNGHTQDFVTGYILEKPNTDGLYAQKYIEIDISQQRMYRWEDGKNIARHSVSTGLYYPTPPGKYKIMNKANNAYSDIYHVWMPYWMAFYLDPKVNAYLGIHELPYWVDGTGTQIRRPSNFIGSPHTGGCVSLNVGEAQEVYNWATVGTSVVIYE